MQIENYDQLINICERNILEAFSLLSIDSPNLEVKREKGYWYVNTKEEYREFNLAMVDDAKNLERIALYFELSNTNGVIYTNLNSENAKDIELSAIKFGYTPLYTTDLMILPKYSIAEPSKFDEVVVNKVTDYANLLIANKIEADALDFPLDQLNRCFGKKALSSSNLSLFLADKYDYPAGTVTVIKNIEMLSIWGMAVDNGKMPEESLQHLGIGEHLLRNVFSIMSKEHPATPFMLLATDAGKPLYKKLGFETIKTYNAWAK